MESFNQYQHLHNTTNIMVNMIHQLSRTKTTDIQILKEYFLKECVNLQATYSNGFYCERPDVYETIYECFEADITDLMECNVNKTIEYFAKMPDTIVGKMTVPFEDFVNELLCCNWKESFEDKNGRVIDVDFAPALQQKLAECENEICDICGVPLNGCIKDIQFACK